MLWGQAAGMEALGELPEGESSNSLKRRGGSGVVYPLIIATRCPLDSYTSSSYSMVYQLNQWEFQDPKMEVLYHIRPYFAGIFTYIGLT